MCFFFFITEAWSIMTNNQFNIYLVLEVGCDFAGCCGLWEVQNQYHDKTGCSKHKTCHSQRLIWKSISPCPWLHRDYMEEEKFSWTFTISGWIISFDHPYLLSEPMLWIDTFGRVKILIHNMFTYQFVNLTKTLK